MLRLLRRTAPVSGAIYGRVSTAQLARSFHTPGDGWQDQLAAVQSALQRSKLLIKAKMIERRDFILTVPGFISRSRERMMSHSYSWSDLAGHGSFLFLAVSYLERDFFHLRLYAMSGVTLSIIFQYYREKPLWIPIRWNSLFLLINAVMIALLIKDDLAADKLSTEEKQLYHEVFQTKGMSRVEFVHLMAKAKRMAAAPEEMLVTDAKRNTRVYLVQSGRVSVRKAGVEVASIGPNNFVGEMSFLTWQTRKEADLRAAASSNASDPIPPAEVSQGVGGYYLSSWYSWAAATVTTAVQLVNPIPEDHSNANATAATGEYGHADAVAVTDCVLYYWRFKDLREMKLQNPSMGMALERCISDDLNKKMISTREQEMRERYKQLVLGATVDGVLTEQAKALLMGGKERFRVSDIEHDKILKEIGWSPEEYITGFKGCMSLAVLKIYEQLILVEVNKGLTDEGKAGLRKFRAENRITVPAHINALKNIGWTHDDYEAGKQTKTAVAADQPAPQKPVLSAPILHWLLGVSNPPVAQRRRTLEDVMCLEPQAADIVADLSPLLLSETD